jgi:tRNA1(Val) A37 N6-methylase TrmN6
VRDTIFGGKVELVQPARGYRVNVDTLILADFSARHRPRARRLVDLGAGPGGLALGYCHLASAARCDLIETVPLLVDLARRNLAAAGVNGSVYQVDLAREGLPAELQATADVVVANPPFFGEHASSPHADALRRRARAGALGPFLRAAAAAMGSKARAYFVYPAPALPELVDGAATVKLVPKVLRFVHAFADSPARLVLVELRKAKPGGLVVEPPLVEWVARGVRSPALAALVDG